MTGPRPARLSSYAYLDEPDTFAPTGQVQRAAREVPANGALHLLTGLTLYSTDPAMFDRLADAANKLAADLRAVQAGEGGAS